MLPCKRCVQVGPLSSSSRTVKAMGLPKPIVRGRPCVPSDVLIYDDHRLISRPEVGITHAKHRQSQLHISAAEVINPATVSVEDAKGGWK